MLLQTLGIILLVALVLTLFIRPGTTLAVMLAVGVVAAAIIVNWNDVQRTRAQRGENAAFQQEQAAVQPNVTVPAPTAAHSGT